MICGPKIEDPQGIFQSIDARKLQFNNGNKSYDFKIYLIT